MNFEKSERFFFDQKILKNPPIIEALFEIKWRVFEKNHQLTQPMDKKFKFFPGRFYEKIKIIYPEVEELPISRIPDDIDIYLPRYRFRKKPNSYPLVQIGPGVLTVNLDKNFSQKLFFESCNETLEIFFEILPDIEILEVLIHYIDGFEFDYENHDAFKFLDEKLHTHFSFSPDLFDHTNISSIPTGFHIEANYRSDSPKGFFKCQLRSGIKKLDKMKLILMDTIFRSYKEDIPLKEELPDWILRADNLIHNWFYKMIENIRELFE